MLLKGPTDYHPPFPLPLPLTPVWQIGSTGSHPSTDNHPSLSPMPARPEGLTDYHPPSPLPLTAVWQMGSTGSHPSTDNRPPLSPEPVRPVEPEPEDFLNMLLKGPTDYHHPPSSLPLTPVSTGSHPSTDNHPPLSPEPALPEGPTDYHPPSPVPLTPEWQIGSTGPHSFTDNHPTLSLEPARPVEPNLEDFLNMLSKGLDYHPPSPLPLTPVWQIGSTHPSTDNHPPLSPELARPVEPEPEDFLNMLLKGPTDYHHPPSPLPLTPVLGPTGLHPPTDNHPPLSPEPARPVEPNLEDFLNMLSKGPDYHPPSPLPLTPVLQIGSTHPSTDNHPPLSPELARPMEPGPEDFLNMLLKGPTDYDRPPSPLPLTPVLGSTGSHPSTDNHPPLSPEPALPKGPTDYHPPSPLPLAPEWQIGSTGSHLSTDNHPLSPEPARPVEPEPDKMLLKGPNYHPPSSLPLTPVWQIDNYPLSPSPEPARPVEPEPEDFEDFLNMLLKGPNYHPPSSLPLTPVWQIGSTESHPSTDNHPPLSLEPARPVEPKFEDFIKMLSKGKIKRRTSGSRGLQATHERVRVLRSMPRLITTPKARLTNG